jgi:hypothetical protein
MPGTRPGMTVVVNLSSVCESLQCVVDCWLKSPRRRFAAKKFQEQNHFDFRCLRGCGESLRRSRLTFIFVPTNCATVSLDKGAF